MLSLLKSVETISSCRDRGRLPCAFSRAVVSLLGESADVGIFVRGAPGDVVLRMVCGETLAHAEQSGWRDFIEEARVDGGVKIRTIDGHNCGAVALHSSELATEQLILGYDVGHGNPAQHVEEIDCLARIYGSQIELLDYSELDTLTHLLNRKTFDETFDRLLTSHAEHGADGRFSDRRGYAEDGSPAWLCVVDVDHFKRVNDSFGHLFGDEVLLRMGELMRKTFRGGDRLFRFGGEEFVLIVRCPNQGACRVTLDRFRERVATYMFPQVGTVTVSLGVTRMLREIFTVTLLDYADQALYHSKKNGRNRVTFFDDLVSQGLASEEHIQPGGISFF